MDYNEIRLINAISSTDINRVKQLLAEGVNPNASDGHLSALMNACKINDSDVAFQLVTCLLQCGASVNCCTRTDDTALIYAADFGHLDCLKLLLDHCADIDHRGDEGFTAIVMAGIAHHNDCVAHLLSRGANIEIFNYDEESPLSILARQDNPNLEAIRSLLEYGANQLSENDQGHTVFHIASAAGNTQVINLINAFNEKQLLDSMMIHEHENQNTLHF